MNLIEPVDQSLRRLRYPVSYLQLWVAKRYTMNVICCVVTQGLGEERRVKLRWNMISTGLIWLGMRFV
jgi:hypothetical protein